MFFLSRCIGIGLIAWGCTHAAYHVSTSGNNTADGSQSTPWQTVAYAASKTASGDQVLLKRGEIFRENNITMPSGIILGAYGTGAKPVVSGAVEITGWTSWAGHTGIYYAPVSSKIENLFVNNKLMLIARYPNTGWILTTGNDAASRIVSATEITANPRNAANYWNDCRMRWRHWNWYYDIRIVQSYTANGTFTLAGSPIQGDGNGATGWGFYMDGKLSELDTAGEWFYDAPAGRVYLYPPAGIALSQALVEGMTATKGLNVSAATVQNISVRHYTKSGIDLDWRSTIDNCLFEGIGSDSGGSVITENWNSSGTKITHCLFRNNLNNAIAVIKDGGNHTESLIEFDTIQNNGIVPGYGGKGSWHGVGVLQYAGNNLRVRYCRFDSTGYAAILFGSPGNTAEYNFINHALTTMVDGGAIYTNCDSTTFFRNIILNTIGSWAGSPFLIENAAGIWPEFLSHFKGQRIIGNTCAYNHRGSGIFLPNNFYSVIKDNVLYDNANGMHVEGGFYTNDNLPMHDSIANNVFYTIMSGRYAFSYRPEYNYGVISGNYYCNPSTDNVIGQAEAPPGNVWNTVAHTLAWWPANWTQYDRTAKTDPIKRAASVPANQLRGTSKLVYNDDIITKVIPLDNGIYVSLDNQQISGSVTLAPFSSIVLVHTGTTAATIAVLPTAKCSLVQPVKCGRGIRFPLSPNSSFRITIMNSCGQVIDAFVVDKSTDRSMVWQGRDGHLPAQGLYHCLIESGEKQSRKKQVFSVVL